MSNRKPQNSVRGRRRLMAMLAWTLLLAVAAGPSVGTAAAEPTVGFSTVTPAFVVDSPTSYVEVGDVATITGKLVGPDGEGLADLPVQLWDHALWWAWTQDATVTTAGDGGFTFQVTVKESNTYQFRFPGTDTLSPAVSTDMYALIKGDTTLSFNTGYSLVNETRSLSFAGQLLSGCCAAASGLTVPIWFRPTGGDWTEAGSGTTDLEGKFTVWLSPQRTGVYQARFTAVGLYHGSVSPEVSVTVAKPVGITAEAVRDASGWWYTVKAQAANEDGSLPGQIISLVRYTPHYGSNLTYTTDVVAEGTSDAHGQVSFDEIRATTGVLYQVTTTFSHLEWDPMFLIYRKEAREARSAQLAVAPLQTYGLNGALAIRDASYNTMIPVTAQVQPAEAGVTVNLVDLEAGSTLASAVTDSAGSAAFSVRATSGNVRYGLEVAAGPDTIASSQPIGSVTVTREAPAAIKAPATVTVGDQATITGTLRWKDSAAPAAGQEVHFDVSTAPGQWSKAGAGVTGDDGQVSIPVVVRFNSVYRMRYFGGYLEWVNVRGADATSGTVLAQRATAATLKASPASVLPGKTVNLVGELTWKSQAGRINGEPVELWQSVAGGSWLKAAAAVSSANASTLWTRAPKYTTRYQLRYSGGRVVQATTALASTSPVVTVHVVAQTSISVPTKARAGQSVTVTGLVKPAKSSQQVTIQVNGRKVATASTDPAGKFTARVKLIRGTAAVRAVTANTAYSDGSSSPVKKIAVT